MAEWLGNLINGWPAWGVIIAIIIIGVVYLIVELIISQGYDSFFAQWIDRRRREKELHRGKIKKT